MVNKPFNRWSRYTAVIKAHPGKEYHQSALLASKNFVTSVEKPETKITNILQEQKKSNIRENRAVLTHIIKAIVFLTKQGIALRGHDESANSKNQGNFLELIKLLSQYAPDLQKHIATHTKASYMSPRSQNELILILGQDIIRAPIIKDIQKAKYFSILCDEATSGKTEYLSLCARYVDEKNCIREEFLNFHPVGKCTGTLLGEQIMERLSVLGLDITNCRGQGYDGAAAMCSNRCGVQTVIREQVPTAAYVHCASHCLNLVIVHACQLIAVKSMIDKVQSVCC